MPESDLDLLIAAAQEAGKIASGYFKDDPQTWEKDGGAGPVTEADLAVDTMLRTELMASRPGYAWLSEETEDSPERLDAETVFIVDPIDGTRAFIEGSRTWSHSLAVAKDGMVMAAVVYLPMRDKLYAAARGQGATLNGAPLRVSESALDGATMLANKWNMNAEYWRDEVPPVQRHFRSSIAYRMALIAEGKFDAMITLRDSWEWDIAAGDLLIREALGLVTDRHNAPLQFNNPHPQTKGVLAANAPLHAALHNALA
ncbi:MAG: 3'(2'),5'-bisphosphate nucleotidase CysQ [Pseudomonadota bacterium]